MTSTTTQDLRDQYPEVSAAHLDDAEFQAAVDRHRTAMKEQFGTFVEDRASSISSRRSPTSPASMTRRGRTLAR